MNLAERGQSAREHFSSLTFDGGDGKPPCGREATLAFTSPGASAVHVCTRQFAAVFHGDTERAVATLIHEQLHTLGLGENPPTSLEITEQVLKRCRR
jgi:hypothetical protein